MQFPPDTEVFRSFTIRALRSGTMKNTPRRPPSKAMIVISKIPGLSIYLLLPTGKVPVEVKIAPAARDSPAEPIVSYYVTFQNRVFAHDHTDHTHGDNTSRNSADTVMPRRATQDTFAAPNTTARMIPITIDVLSTLSNLFQPGYMA